jgi:uncharacterized glyoxalase superfamily protein PhnB
MATKKRATKTKKEGAKRPAPRRKAAKKPAPRKKAIKRPASRKKPAQKATVQGTPARRVLGPRHQPETLRLRSAAAGFTVNDIEKSVAFYRDILGFIVKERWEENGKLLGVEMVAGGVSFMLGQDDWKKGRDRVKGEGFRIYCTTVQDVDALAAQIKSRGGQLLEEPKTQSWGTRDFAVADPDGFKITFSSDMT